MSATKLEDVDAALADCAPLPRDNGELVFEEPWQGRALGMGVVVLDRLGIPWAEFREHLVDAIQQHRSHADESAASAYYAAWLEALGSLLTERVVIQPAALRGRRDADARASASR
jgi:nitrile hydratase accessory protein